MKKRILSLFAVVSLALLASCDDSPKATDPSISATDANTTTIESTSELTIEQLDKGYSIFFILDDNVQVKIYTTGDFKEATSESVSRDSKTGLPLSDGSGQINFELLKSLVI